MHHIVYVPLRATYGWIKLSTFYSFPVQIFFFFKHPTSSLLLLSSLSFISVLYTRFSCLWSSQQYIDAIENVELNHDATCFECLAIKLLSFFLFFFILWSGKAALSTIIAAAAAAALSNTKFKIADRITTFSQFAHCQFPQSFETKERNSERVPGASFHKSLITRYVKIV